MFVASRPPFARFRRLFVGFAALAVSFVVLCLPAVSSAAEKGLVTDMSWGTSSSTQDQTAAAMTDVGAKWSRVNLSWSDIEKTQGSYSATAVSMYDGVVQRSVNAGVKVIIMVDRAPGWASGSSNIEAPATDPTKFANFVRWLSAHYAGKVAAYEIWNEENTVRFWPSGVNPAQYVALLKAAYPAVKASDPNAKVLFGGMALNDYPFVEACYAVAPDLGSYFDVMATHPYTPSGVDAPETIVRRSDGRIDPSYFPAYREVRASMLARGDDKPIWFTELGWATGPGYVSEATQADYLTRAYTYIEQDPYVQVATWYNFRDNYWGTASNWEDSLGLMRKDFSHKPAYDAFKAYAPGPTATPRRGGKPR